MNPSDKFTCTKCDGTRKLYWVDYRSGFPFKSESPCDLCAWFPEKNKIEFTDDTIWFEKMGLTPSPAVPDPSECEQLRKEIESDTSRKATV